MWKGNIWASTVWFRSARKCEKGRIVDPYFVVSSDERLSGGDGGGTIHFHIGVAILPHKHLQYPQHLERDSARERKKELWIRPNRIVRLIFYGTWDPPSHCLCPPPQHTHTCLDCVNSRTLCCCLNQSRSSDSTTISLPERFQKPKCSSSVSWSSGIPFRILGPPENRSGWLHILRSAIRPENTWKWSIKTQYINALINKTVTVN